MSQISPPASSDVTGGHPVTNLTLVVLLLIPCVVVLLLLNCLFLGYKLLQLSKESRRRQTRGDPEEMLVSQSTRVRAPDVALPPLRDGSRAYTSLSEPVPHRPVTSSRASSRERPEVDHRFRLHLRPDGATGSGSLRAPSTVRAISSVAGLSPRLDDELPPGFRIHSVSQGGWCGGAPGPPQSRDSEVWSRVNLAPPNSPAQETGHMGRVRRGSLYEMLSDGNPGVPAHFFDNVDMETERSSSPPSAASGLNTSAVGPGLDSDFGASAGVSLRILSGDSDGLSNSVLPSALEWDYYDPCYVKQNNVPKLKHHRPAMHTKQYWV